MKLQRAAGLFLIMCLLAISAQFALSQSNDQNLPRVESTEMVDAYIGNVSFAISNNGDFVYTCQGWGGCSIWDRQANQGGDAFPFQSVEAYWSIDNTVLIMMDNDTDCPSDSKQYDLVLFGTQTRMISRHCSPKPAYSYSWSPIIPSQFYIGPILDLNTFQSTSFSYITSLDLSDLDHYQGYGDTFWDVSTQVPVGRIFLKQEENNQLQFTQSEFHICTLDGKQCLPIVDTLAVAPVDVFTYKLYKNWILWAGHASADGQAVNIKYRPWKIADTVLYMTDFYTGSTHELFRFSSVGLTSQYVSDIAWSPDGKTIGLALSPDEIDPIFLPTIPPLGTHLAVPSSTPPGTPAPTPMNLPGLLLLHIVWPSTLK